MGTGQILVIDSAVVKTQKMFSSRGGSLTKLRSEIAWNRFFAVAAFIRHFRPYIAVRKLVV